MQTFFRLCVLSMLISTWVFSQAAVEADGSILLPSQTEYSKPFTASEQFVYTASQRWQSFIQEHGQWSVQWNEATGTPHRAYGKSIRIPGFANISQENVEAAARTFINQNTRVLRVNPADLKLNRAQKIRDKWYVSFVQMKEDIQVLFSEVELRLFENGNLMAFGVDFYTGIDVDLTPSISLESAKTSAISGLDFNTETDIISGDGQLYILPKRFGKTVSHHLVYHINVNTKSGPGNFEVFVDAHSGEIIWRHNRVRFDVGEVTVTGEVQLEIPTGPFVELPMSDLNITVDGQQFVTDSMGVAATGILTPSSMSASLKGPWLDVRNANGPDASFSTTLNPGDPLNILWDDSNSLASERDSYFHSLLIYNWLKELDPAFTGNDYSMPCSVNIGPEHPFWPCNAFWDGTGINFFNAGGQCPDIGQMPSVVYHEYGHGINDNLYIQAGAPFGMINGSTHEGLADVASSSIEDVPNIGRGFFGPGTTLRFVSNNNRYPDDVTGSSHSNGLIIGGAFWDTRLLTSLEVAADLFHFAKWGTPDDPDVGIAFSEWFLEVLIVDDDDGDLSNGTPHFAEIAQAFNRHGIGTTLFLNMTFDHIPHPNTPDTSNPYPIQFSFLKLGAGPDSVSVHYSTDGFQTTTTVAAMETNPGEYEAEIPAQNVGATVNYYITAYDPFSSTTLRFPANSEFSFLVGFTRVAFSDMEADNGWTVGAADDDATTGIWNRMDPQATSLGSQPEDDTTPNGTQCFVTDGNNDPNNAGAFDIDGGKTTLFSPVYNVSNFNDPIVSYQKWYSNDLGNNPDSDFWVVDVSADSGATWVNIENTSTSTNAWVKYQFNLNDVVTGASTVQFRFIASDEGGGSLVEACVDDFEILALDTTMVGITDNETALPRQFSLDQNYPNPFNPTTSIRYSLPENAQVSIRIFNLLGQEVRTLISADAPAGIHTAIWDGKDQAGTQVASGIYLYRMEAISTNEKFVQSRKLMLLK